METKQIIEQIIKPTQKLLLENKEWEDRYEGYIKKIAQSEQKKANCSFHKPEGLSLYSSVSRDGKSFDLRFKGQSVATVTEETNGKIYLKPKKDAVKKYFELDLSEQVDWNSDDTCSFRSSAKKKSSNCKSETNNPHSKEHCVESCLLREFSKRTDKALRRIQPVKLYKAFFQMPTPLKASEHKPEYSKQYGGGIDILARVTPREHGSGESSRICVMEVKDENKPQESQANAMQQALTYAVFIAHLLRSKSGQHWWDFFMGKTLTTTAASDGEIEISVLKDNRVNPNIPDELIIDVATIMPKGETEEYRNERIPLEGLNVTLHCHSLYYDDEAFKKNEKFIFSGTYPAQLKEQNS